MLVMFIRVTMKSSLSKLGGVMDCMKSEVILSENVCFLSELAMTPNIHH